MAAFSFIIDEYNIYKKTEYPGGLWLSKQKYIYQIYATIIGVLDARYDSYNRMLNFEEERIFKNEDDITLNDIYTADIKLSTEIITELTGFSDQLKPKELLWMIKSITD